MLLGAVPCRKQRDNAPRRSAFRVDVAHTQADAAQFTAVLSIYEESLRNSS